MRFGVFGTGMVGRGIASRLVELDHDVMMGSRSATGEALTEWTAANGEHALGGTFAEAAGYGEMLVNATGGAVSLQALRTVGPQDMAGKVLIDVANPLLADGPGPLAVCNSDSLGEQLQREFPETRVVKALNTMNVDVMVDPGKVPGEHVVFVSGDDPEAKTAVTALLGTFGWPAHRVIDLGGIVRCRGTEMYLPLWMNLYGILGTGHFNLAISG